MNGGKRRAANELRKILLRFTYLCWVQLNKGTKSVTAIVANPRCRQRFAGKPYSHFQPTCSCPILGTSRPTKSRKFLCSSVTRCMTNRVPPNSSHNAPEKTVCQQAGIGCQIDYTLVVSIIADQMCSPPASGGFAPRSAWLWLRAPWMNAFRPCVSKTADLWAAESARCGTFSRHVSSN